MRQISLLRKAGPLKRLNDYANGFLAEEEGREALPQKDRQSQFLTCHYQPQLKS